MDKRTGHSTRWPKLIELVTDLDHYIRELETRHASASSTEQAVQDSDVATASNDGSNQPLTQVNSTTQEGVTPSEQADDVAIASDLEGTLTIDLSRPVFRQDPPVCHYYHLLADGCPRAPDCNFSHDYKLSEEEKLALSDSVKRMPCDSVRPNSNKECQYGPDCIHGHTCPWDDRCTRDPCQFGDIAHPRRNARIVSQLRAQNGGQQPQLYGYRNGTSNRGRGRGRGGGRGRHLASEGSVEPGEWRNRQAEESGAD